MKLPTAKPGPRPSTAAEFASDEERSKFRVLRPIQKEEIRMTDLEDLIRRLQAG
jgi:hypothetical protein